MDVATVMMLDHDDENELVLRAQEGDAMAFEQLVCRYDRQVLSIAMSFCRNTDDARDIYQEVFLRVYRALPGFRQESKFSTWLHRIATNVCLTHRSQSRRHKHESLDQDFQSPDGKSYTLSDRLAAPEKTEEAAREQEASGRLTRAMESLSNQQRLVFSLRHFQGYKLKDIAGMLACAEGTVKKHLFTANEKLREQLKDYLR